MNVELVNPVTGVVVQYQEDLMDEGDAQEQPPTDQGQHHAHSVERKEGKDQMTPIDDNQAQKITCTDRGAQTDEHALEFVNSDSVELANENLALMKEVLRLKLRLNLK